MPRIIVTTDPRPDHPDPAVLLDETVHSVHLSTDHASAQLVERLAWAIVDAEQTEAERLRRRERTRAQRPTRAAAIRAPQAHPLAA